MTAEQLRAARREHWRQNQNPVLTSEEARSWLQQHPLCLFLPRQSQLPAPAPSFVEAVGGEANPTPPPAAVERASELLAGLVEAGTVIPLNLFGGAGEQPEFLAHAEILPFIAALRGDRDWKHAPANSGGRHVSPLVLELWQLLEQAGPLTAAAAREKLGRELTESAVLRALDELWQRLRAIPAVQPAGRPAVWELFKARHGRALAAGSATSQVTAISLLVSTYLQSVYAASGEEIETFLSPLAARSRIREAVHGLSATRQIHSLSMDAHTYYFLEGGLPEFAPEPPARREPAPSRAIAAGEQRAEEGGARPELTLQPAPLFTRQPALPPRSPARASMPPPARRSAFKPTAFRPGARQKRGERPPGGGPPRHERFQGKHRAGQGERPAGEKRRIVGEPKWQRPVKAGERRMEKPWARARGERLTTDSHARPQRFSKGGWRSQPAAPGWSKQKKRQKFQTDSRQEERRESRGGATRPSEASGAAPGGPPMPESRAGRRSRPPSWKARGTFDSGKSDSKRHRPNKPDFAERRKNPWKPRPAGDFWKSKPADSRNKAPARGAPVIREPVLRKPGGENRGGQPPGFRGRKGQAGFAGRKGQANLPDKRRWKKRPER